jgi:hypothetical protein
MKAVLARDLWAPNATRSLILDKAQLAGAISLGK